MMGIEERTPIPPIFHSLERGGPFRHCLICERDLRAKSAAGEVEYLIERIFRGAEPILEYAVCQPCRDGLHSEISAESQDRIAEYTQDVLNPEAIVQRSAAMAAGEVDVDELLERCLITSAPARDCYERQICAVCVGDSLVLDAARPVYPMMLSGTFIRGLSDVLSEATRGWMDDFVGDRFGMSPDMIGAPSLY